MNVGRVMRGLRGIPPGAVAAEAFWRLRRRYWLARDRAAPDARSYSEGGAGVTSHLLPVPPPGLAPEMRASLQSWCERYLRHEFDLLGSGWTRVDASRGSPDADYAPIDWQLDFKSGYRWSARTWHRDIRFGEVAGADVKVPWELARMQHLPQLALAALAGIVPVERAAREFHSQVLDFKMANPPGWGVNWSNPMEAAIRASNWLIAWDLLWGAGHRFDAVFAAGLRAAILDHGRYVAANLEWHPRYRGNHYLANLAGLVFCGAWLDGDEADAWLAFGIRGIESETARQFNPDGSGFEASTCYHRLSAEIATYATAVALAVPRERFDRLARLSARIICPQHGLKVLPLERSAMPFGSAHFAALRRMAQFTRAATKPDGRVVQVGDNDSGRFARLSWAVRGDSEDHLDHRHLVAAIDALLGGGSSPGDGGGYDAMMFEQLAVAAAASVASLTASPGVADPDWDEAQRRIGAMQGAATRVRVLARGPGLTKNLSCAAFPDFGLHVLRSERLWLSVRCGEVGIEPLGAHAHNDQLAIELVVDGENKVRDPGSFIYTPAPALRNAYRSAAAHDVPRLAGREPASLEDGIFRLRNGIGARCLYFGARGFIGVHAGYGAPVCRVVSLSDGELKVEDRSLAGPLDESGAPPPFSPGYGLQER